MLIRPGGRLPRAFFDRPVLQVAPSLLDCVISHRTNEGVVGIRLTEVEAYAGVGDDHASHAHRGRTNRNASMFGEPGTLYVYFTYGMHWCVNLVCESSSLAAAVLLRAGEVVEGATLAAERRATSRRSSDLAQGPARLSVALGIAGKHDGLDFCQRSSVVGLHAGESFKAEGLVGRESPSHTVSNGPRVGIAAAGANLPWRFWIEGEPTVSRWRSGRTRRSR